MRIVEREEVSMMKCYYCGGKNKLVLSYGTEENRHRPESFTVRSCNCGKVETFNRDWKQPLDAHISTKKFKQLEVQCIEHHACPHNDCPYYGKENKPYPKPKTDHRCICDDNGCGCISIVPPPKFK